MNSVVYTRLNPESCLWGFFFVKFIDISFLERIRTKSRLFKERFNFYHLNWRSRKDGEEHGATTSTARFFVKISQVQYRRVQWDGQLSRRQVSVAISPQVERGYNTSALEPCASHKFLRKSFVDIIQ